MKKRLIGAVLTAVVLMVLFAACSNDPQEVSVVSMKQADAPSNVKAVQTTDKQYVIVTWDAAQNGVSYGVYAQLEGKKTVFSVGGYAQNYYTYSTKDGDTSTNDDIDKWSLRYRLYSLDDLIGSVRFGVIAEDIDATSQFSGVSWTDYITVVAP